MIVLYDHSAVEIINKLVFKEIMLKRLIAQQFRRPSGLLGHYAANFMKKNNQDYYAHVCDRLNLKDNDTVLEIGCGAGYAIQLITEKNTQCKVDALDFSPMMLKKAVKNNRNQISTGRVQFFMGDFGDYNFGDVVYSKIFAINVIYFWNDLSSKFSKIYSLLETGGRLILFMSSPERLQKIPFAIDGVFNKYTVAQVENDLSGAGFIKVNHERVVKNETDTFYICADK